MIDRNIYGVSLYVVTYNRFLKGARLIKQLSLQRVNFPTELIVVDASDNLEISQEIKSTLAEYKSLIHSIYIHCKRPSVSFQRNIALLQAKYRVIGYLDDDMVPKGRDWLHQMCEPILMNKVDIVAGRIHTKPSVTEWLTEKYMHLVSQCEPHLTENMIIDDLYFVPIGGNLFFRKNLIVSCGGFQTNLGHSPENPFLTAEETDVFFNLRLHGATMLFRQDSMVYHFLSNHRLEKKFLFQRQFWQGVSDNIIYWYEPRFIQWWRNGISSIIEWSKGDTNYSLHLFVLHNLYLFGWIYGWIYRLKKRNLFEKRTRPFLLSPADLFSQCDQWEIYGEK